MNFNQWKASGTLLAERAIFANSRELINVGSNDEGLDDAVSMEWPCFGDKLIYDCPLPNHCPCKPPPYPFKGLNLAEDFVSSSSLTLGVRFSFVDFAESISLRDGSLLQTYFRVFLSTQHCLWLQVRFLEDVLQVVEGQEPR